MNPTQNFPEEGYIPYFHQNLHQHTPIPGAHVFYIDQGKVANRVMHLRHPQNRERVIFVPNWIAKPKHWREFVLTLYPHYSVIYFETREKRHTKYKAEKLAFTVEQMGQDLAAYLNQLKGSYHLVGASVGATSIIKAWKHILTPPQTLTLICPILQLKLPWHTRIFPHVPQGVIRSIGPLFHKLATYSPMLKPVSRSLYQAFQQKDLREMKVLKASIKDLLKMEVGMDEVRQIQCPTLVMRAVEDKMHMAADVDRIVDCLSANVSLDFPSFRAVHGKESAEAIVAWLKSTSMGWPQNGLTPAAS